MLVEKFSFEYECGHIRHGAEMTGEVIVISEVIDFFKNFLRGAYCDELVDQIRILGPGCK